MSDAHVLVVGYVSSEEEKEEEDVIEEDIVQQEGNAAAIIMDPPAANDDVADLLAEVDNFVQAEDIDLLLERMGKQFASLRKAFEDELEEAAEERLRHTNPLDV